MNRKRSFLASCAIVYFFFMVFGNGIVSSASFVAADELANPRKPAVGNSASQLSNLYTPSGRPKTFVDSQTRKKLESIPITERPNRPLHFYGNAVRRRANAAESGPFGGSSLIRR